MCSAASPGRSTSRADPLLIFDLDGTILSVNSFPHWARYMLAGRFVGLNAAQRLALSLQTSGVLLQRKLLGHSHYLTKRRLQRLWAYSLQKDANQIALHHLSAKLQDYVRPNLRGLMERVASGNVDALLATSAAGEYARGLGAALGFSHVLTTPLCTESDRMENCKERKRDRVLSLLEAQGWNDRLRIFFTDHEEDLPLIRACHRTLWFGRDEDAAALKKRMPQAEIIACGNKHYDDIVRLACS